MSYGRISEAYWHDDVIRGLSEPARYFMLYLMSCPHGNRLGLFVLAPAYAAEDLDCDSGTWDGRRVIQILEELVEKGRIRWDRPNRVVFVRYYLRHNVLSNGSVVKGALNELAGLPRTELFLDLLEAVIEERKGDKGQPIRGHYADLEAELQNRCRLAGIDVENGLEAGRLHRAAVNADTVPSLRGARARAALPHLTLPNPTLPNRTYPPPLTDEEREDGEDDGDLELEIRKHFPQAKRNIIEIHGGTEEDVRIGEHDVGVGLDLDAYKRICREGRDPPELIAVAIAFIPRVSDLEPPVSLARWGADDGRPIYEQCLGLAHKELSK